MSTYTSRFVRSCGIALVIVLATAVVVSGAVTHTQIWDDAGVDGDTGSLATAKQDMVAVGVSGNNNEFYAHDLDDGNRRFLSAYSEGFWAGSLRVAEDEDYAIWTDDTDGIEIWSYDTGNRVREIDVPDFTGGNIATTEVHDGTIYFVYQNESDSHLYVREYDFQGNQLGLHNVTNETLFFNRARTVAFNPEYSDNMYISNTNGIAVINSNTWNVDSSKSFQAVDMVLSEDAVYLKNTDQSNRIEKWTHGLTSNEWVGTTTNTGSFGIDITPAQDAVSDGGTAYWANGTEIWQNGQKGSGFGLYRNDTGFFNYVESNNGGVTAWTTNVTIEAAPQPGLETGLELVIDSWMPFNEEQSYTVYLNETNTTSGNSNITDVTANANVTIYNITNTTGFSEPIASVNNSSDTIRSYNQTGVVAVNATYDGNTLANASNLTVGNRNLSNIGIMPPEQWPCSFLGCDENPKTGDNPHNIGSPMQWLLLIIVIMVAATRFIENPWAGVGTGIMFSILAWVLEYIDLGSVLITVFSGLLIGAMMARTQMGRGVTRDNEQSGIASTQVRNRNE